MSNKVGRKSKELTESMKKEAKEILELALKDVGGIKSKVTYNNVAKFNKDIANNPNYSTTEGKSFSDFGVRFWGKEYEGKPYYGRQLIDNLKKDSKINLAGESFEISNKDIESLVNRYHTKPEELKRRLINLFLKDRNLIKSLKVQNENLLNDLKAKKEEINCFQDGFATMFWNSSSSNNSLKDVLTLSRPDDEKIYDEFKNMCNNDRDIMDRILEKKSIYEGQTKEDPSAKETVKGNNNLINIQARLNQMGISSSTEDGL